MAYLLLHTRDHFSSLWPVLLTLPCRSITFRLLAIASTTCRLVLLSGRYRRATAVSPYTSHRRSHVLFYVTRTVHIFTNIYLRQSQIQYIRTHCWLLACVNLFTLNFLRFFKIHAGVCMHIMCSVCRGVTALLSETVISDLLICCWGWLVFGNYLLPQTLSINFGDLADTTKPPSASICSQCRTFRISGKRFFNSNLSFLSYKWQCQSTAGNSKLLPSATEHHSLHHLSLIHCQTPDTLPLC